MTVPGQCRKGIFAYECICTACQSELMPDIRSDLIWLEPLERVVDCDPLAECLMDRFFQRIVQVWLAAQDQ